MRKIILHIFYFAFIARALAQAYPEIGSQSIDNYTPKDYHAGNSNFVIAQDNQGIMYFGNGGAGLLEFDGKNWQLYPLDNKSSVYSMAISDDGRIYVGAQNDLGYFSSDSIGRLVYRSLKELIPEEKREFSVAWETEILNGKVYFRAGDCVLIWDPITEKFEMLEAENGINRLYVIHDKIYLEHLLKH